MRKITIKTEIAQKTGMEKKGIYHTISVKAEPKIGLNTFPAVFEVSIIPKVALASSSLRKISPTRGRTIGIAPEAPIPCKILPINIMINGFSIFQEAKPAINTPIHVIMSAETINYFLPYRYDK